MDEYILTTALEFRNIHITPKKCGVNKETIYIVSLVVNEVIHISEDKVFLGEEHTIERGNVRV